MLKIADYDVMIKKIVVNRKEHDRCKYSSGDPIKEFVNIHLQAYR